MNSFIIKILATALISISAISFIIYQKSEIKNLELNLDIEKQNVITEKENYNKLLKEKEKAEKLNEVNIKNIKEQSEKIKKINSENNKLKDDLAKANIKRSDRDLKDLAVKIELMDSSTNKYVEYKTNKFNEDRKNFRSDK